MPRKKPLRPPSVEPLVCSAELCAEGIMEVMPAMVGSLRHELRHDPANVITFVQFRVLSFLQRQGSSSLSGVAEHLELGLPASSKLLDGLVEAGFVERTTDHADRRRLMLEVTPSGAETLRGARLNNRRHLSAILSPLNEQERADVSHAMTILRRLLAERAQRCTSSR